MPVTVVVGGQYGSEGKGKVAAILSREQRVAAVVRVGGPNSGHTPDDPTLPPLQQLPTAAYANDAVSVLPPGSYIDNTVLESEIERTQIGPGLLKVSPYASIITQEERDEEFASELGTRIGSTQTGTGAAVSRRVMRARRVVLASDVPSLKPYLTDTSSYLRALVDGGQRVLVEGTQGFGLSVLHGGCYPYATSRDTSAAGALSEAGLSPVDVDDVTMVLRAFPIRVGGHSGPLLDELTWQQLEVDGEHDHELCEYTTVTRRLRRVAHFDPSVVLRAISVNSPTCIVMNHLDYVDHRACISGEITDRIESFLVGVQSVLGRRIDRLGLGKGLLCDWPLDLARPSEAFAQHERATGCASTVTR